MRNSVALIGLGNILLQDEGVGVHAVGALQRNYDFPEGVRLIDGGTLGLDLLPLIEGVEKILFVDAMDLKKEPGTIAVIEDQEIPSLERMPPAARARPEAMIQGTYASRSDGGTASEA